MARFEVIDLSALPPPAVVEPLDYEAILAAMLADLAARAPELSGLAESDPAMKVLQVAAYREMLLRGRVNDAARAVLLPHATGADLDNLGGLFGVARRVLDPGNPAARPPVPPVLETDAALRRRIQLSLSGYSTAGPVAAYLFHALDADVRVKDVSVVSPVPGTVRVAVLSTIGNGAAPSDLLAAVTARLSAEDVRPLCDTVQVVGASILTYTVTAALTLLPGPDAAVVRDQALAALAAYTADRHALGADIALSGLYAALHRPGVQRVALTAPTADIVVGTGQAAWCTGVTVTTVGVDE